MFSCATLLMLLIWLVAVLLIASICDSAVLLMSLIFPCVVSVIPFICALAAALTASVPDAMFWLVTLLMLLICADAVLLISSIFAFVTLAMSPIFAITRESMSLFFASTSALISPIFAVVVLSICFKHSFACSTYFLFDSIFSSEFAAISFASVINWMILVYASMLMLSEADWTGTPFLTSWRTIELVSLCPAALIPNTPTYTSQFFSKISAGSCTGATLSSSIRMLTALSLSYDPTYMVAVFVISNHSFEKSKEIPVIATVPLYSSCLLVIFAFWFNTCILISINLRLLILLCTFQHLRLLKLPF